MSASSSPSPSYSQISSPHDHSHNVSSSTVRTPPNNGLRRGSSAQNLLNPGASSSSQGSAHAGSAAARTTAAKLSQGSVAMSRFEPPPSPDRQDGSLLPTNPSPRLPPRIPGADRPDFLGSLEGSHALSDPEASTSDVLPFRVAPPPPSRKSLDQLTRKGSPASTPSACPGNTSSLHVLMQGSRTRVQTSSSASPFLNAHAQAQGQHHPSQDAAILDSPSSSEGLARYLAMQGGSGNSLTSSIRPIYTRRASKTESPEVESHTGTTGDNVVQPPPIRAKHLTTNGSSSSGVSIEGRSSKHRPGSSGMGSAATAGSGVVNAIGQLGGIVGRKGWEFVRTGVQNLGNGPSSPGFSPRARGHSSAHSVTLGAASGNLFSSGSAPHGVSPGEDTNEATRRWLEAPEPSLGAGGPQTSGTSTTVGKMTGLGGPRRSPHPFGVESSEADLRGIFGAPLRDVVLATRLGNRLPIESQAATSAQTSSLARNSSNLDTLDLGSDFASTDAFMSTDDLSAVMANSVDGSSNAVHQGSTRRQAVSREEARLRYLPCVVTRCVESLERWGSSEEGIYRLSGRSSHTAKLRTIFSMPPPSGDLQLVDIGPAELDLNSVCSVLKSYLRDLPEPLLTHDLGPRFDEACLRITGKPATGAAGLGPGGAGSVAARAQASTPKHIIESASTQSVIAASSGDPAEEAARQSEALAEEVLGFVGQLPAPNWYVLRELSLHFNALVKSEVVRTTKMPLSNLCLVLSPTFGISGVLLRTFITHVDIIFDAARPPLPDHELDGHFGPPARPRSIFAPPLLSLQSGDDKRGSTMTVRPSNARRPSDIAPPKITSGSLGKSSDSLLGSAGPTLNRSVDKPLSSPSRPGFFSRAAKISQHRRREASVSSGSAVDESVSSRSSSPFESTGHAPTAYKAFGSTSATFDPMDLSDVQRISRKYARSKTTDSEGDAANDGNSLGSSTTSHTSLAALNNPYSGARDEWASLAASPSTTSLGSDLPSPLEDRAGVENVHARKNSALDRPRPVTRSSGASIFPNGQTPVIVTRTRARSVRNGDANSNPPVIAPKPAGLVSAGRGPVSPSSSSQSASIASLIVPSSPRTTSSPSGSSALGGPIQASFQQKRSPSSPLSLSGASATTPDDARSNAQVDDWSDLRRAVEQAGQSPVTVSAELPQEEERTLDLKERKKLLGLA